MTLDKDFTLAVLRAGCSHIENGYNSHSALGECGVSVTNFELLIGESLWYAKHRTPITRTLQSLRDGLAVAIGYTPFRVPAEYVAAQIAFFVNGVNAHAACAWLCDATSVMDIIENGPERFVAVSSSELFAMYLLCVSDVPHFRNLHDCKVRKEIDHANFKPIVDQSSES